MMTENVVNYELADEGDGNKLMRKFREEPLLPIGLLSLVTALGIGAYRMKTATKTQSTSVYLMQLRVIAQSSIIGVLALSMFQNIYKNLTKKDDA